VRRWTLLIAGAALWLFLAAIPALADGGPHVSQANSGTSTLTADNCAGCHRAHTAQARFLLAEEEEALCLSCHGSQGVGATTDVELGIQYKVALDPGSAGQGTGASVVAGALRGGGFVEARIASSTASRVFQSGSAINVWGKVGVGPGQPVTSAHLNLATNGLNAPTVAWGNDGLNTGAGPTVSMSCGSCHNPHGNGQYRILNPIPKPTDTTAGTLVPVSAPGVTVTDAALPSAGDSRNYTVIQVRGTVGTPSSFLLYASQLATGGYGATAGDYWHVRVPWNSTTNMADAPNGVPSGLPGAAFNDQIAAWCTACHTRYFSTSAIDDLPDTIYKYRHQTTGRTTCATCHVAHGSNAPMTGTYSAAFPYPDDPSTAPAAIRSGSSRLLKVDNRGTCQMCHDPTGTVDPGQYTGPAPIPGAP
jgi:predicted CXXCH cytochrome family protein